MEQPPYIMDDEIDLRRYVAVLLKYWYWIVGAGVIVAAVAFAYLSSLPKTYQAQADALILETRTELTLDPNFQTVIDELDVRNSVKTLESLVKSNDVATAVVAQGADLLAPEEQSARKLLGRVSAASTGNIISIAVVGGSPEQAAGLANLWATVYIDYVNNLYSSQKGSLLSEVKSQADEVRERYQTMQSDLEELLANNRIDALNREIQTKKQQVQRLQDRAAVIETTPLYLFEQQQDNQRQILSGKYGELQQVEGWLTDAAALEAQLAVAPDRPENQLALLLLRSKMAGNEAVQLQLNPAEFEAEPVTADDVAQVTAGLEQYQANLLTEIDQLETALTSQTVAVPESLPVSTELAEQIAQMDAEILQLEGELEAQRANMRELSQARDLAWENLNTIRRKVAEVELTSQMTNTRLRSAGTAVPPEGASGPRRLVNTAIAGVLGLMLAVFAVFAWEWWRDSAAAAPLHQSAEDTRNAEKT